MDVFTSIQEEIMFYTGANVFQLKTRYKFGQTLLCVLATLVAFYLWRTGYDPRDPRHAPPLLSFFCGIYGTIWSLRIYTVTDTQLIISICSIPIRRKSPEDIRQIVILYPGDSRNPEIKIPKILFVENICERYDPEKHKLSTFLKKHPIAAVSFNLPQGDQYESFIGYVETYWGLVEHARSST